MPLVNVVCVVRPDYLRRADGYYRGVPTKRDVPLCDLEASLMSRSWPTKGRWVMKKKVTFYAYKSRIYASLIRFLGFVIPCIFNSSNKTAN